MMKIHFGLLFAPIATALKLASAVPIVGEEWSCDTSGSSTVYRFDVYPNFERGTLPRVMQYSYNEMKKLHDTFTKDGIVLNAMPWKWFVRDKNVSTINRRGPLFREMLQEMFEKRDRLNNADAVLPCPFNINIGSREDFLPDEIKIAVLENDTFDEVARSLAKGLRRKFPIAGSLLMEGSLLSSYDFLTLKFAGEEPSGEIKLSDAGVEENAVMTMSWKDDFKGSITFSNGDRYEGEWERYEGEYQNGKPHGQGTGTFSNGNRYDGEFHNGKAHGQSIFTYANGDRYEGEYRDGALHGQGIFITRDGLRRREEWDQDKLIRKTGFDFLEPSFFH